MPPGFALHRRTALLWAGASACSALARPAEGPPRAELLGWQILPSGLRADGHTLAGLSGLDYDPLRDTWWVLSDDRGSWTPARAWSFRADWTPKGLVQPRDWRVAPLASRRHPKDPQRLRMRLDPESLRWREASETLLWTSEGHARRRVAPAVLESDPHGRFIRQWPLPSHLTTFAVGRGPVFNEGLEGLALCPSGRGAWVAMEGPLLQDLASHPQAAAPCRLTWIPMTPDGQPREVAYVADPPPRSPWPMGYTFNGISEILLRDERRLWVLERAYTLGLGQTVKLFECDLHSGSDTAAQNPLIPGRYTPVKKQLLLDFDRIGLPFVDNLEGMCWGPPPIGKPAGTRSLVLVSDDNFNPFQRTLFVSLAISES